MRVHASHRIRAFALSIAFALCACRPNTEAAPQRAMTRVEATAAERAAATVALRELDAAIRILGPDARTPEPVVIDWTLLAAQRLLREGAILDTLVVDTVGGELRMPALLYRPNLSDRACKASMRHPEITTSYWCPNANTVVAWKWDAEIPQVIRIESPDVAGTVPVAPRWAMETRAGVHWMDLAVDVAFTEDSGRAALHDVALPAACSVRSFPWTTLVPTCAAQGVEFEFEAALSDQRRWQDSTRTRRRTMRVARQGFRRWELRFE